MKKSLHIRILKLNKENIITFFFVLLCLIGYVFFPASGYFQYKAVALFFLVLLPFIYDKYILKNINFFRRVVVVGDVKKNLLYLLVGVIAPLIIIFLLFRFTDLQKHYLLPTLVRKDFGQFLLYEILGVPFSVIIYEIFFRGFVQFYFAAFFEKWAILIQILFFIALVYLLNLPYWFYISYLVFTPFAGWIAYKSKSIVYSFAGQWLFIILVDAGYIALINSK